ncbi:MAG: hypothetical protein EOP39_14970 [Rubrivivax sp.]|nr:MAG: hypothetical protein EOP39_14970 [Rubrivivax sp.]
MHLPVRGPQPEAEALAADEAESVDRGRRGIADVAIEEAGHRLAVWNIAAACGGAPCIGRSNFPLDPDLALGLMRAFAPLAEHAARLPAGPSHAGCHASVSFTARRDAAAMPHGPAAGRFVGRATQPFCDGTHQRNGFAAA